MQDLNARLLCDWDHPSVQPEGWIFAVVPNIPDSGEIAIYSQSETMRCAMERRGETIWPPYKIEVPAHCVAPIGRTGPFLALAVASARSKGNPQFLTPQFHRLLLHAIAGEHNPAPVESSGERDIVLLLQRRRIPFVKPVFDDVDGLRPDFILPKNKVIVEVQGMTNDEYREHKREIHQRMKASQAYNGYQIITFDVNDGEMLDNFERRLMKII